MNDLIEVAYHQQSLGDEPSLHRWRATWRRSYDGHVDGISLEAYGVVSLTDMGAWIDPYSVYWINGWEFYGGSPHKRLVMNGSGSSWAKLTKDEAVMSLTYRLKRWAQKTRAELARVEEAVRVAETLFPGNVRVRDAKGYL